jgi:hypothetical protein
MVLAMHWHAPQAEGRGGVRHDSIILIHACMGRMHRSIAIWGCMRAVVRNVCACVRRMDETLSVGFRIIVLRSFYVL